MTPTTKQLAGVIALALWLIAGAVPLPRAGADRGSLARGTAGGRGGTHASLRPAAAFAMAAAGKSVGAYFQEAGAFPEDHGCSHCTAACFEGHGHVCMDGGAKSQAGPQNPTHAPAPGTRSAPCLKGNPCSGGAEADLQSAPLQIRALAPEPPAPIIPQPSRFIPAEAATLASVLLSDPTPPPESARSNPA